MAKNAISTYGITLSTSPAGETATWTKLVDIKDFPDLGGEPDLIEVTTLSDPQERFIEGIKGSEAMPFTCNYNLIDYTAVNSTAGTELQYKIEFGEDGEDGGFTWNGVHSVRVSGAGVNDAVEMIVQVVPSSEILPVT